MKNSFLKNKSIKSCLDFFSRLSISAIFISAIPGKINDFDRTVEYISSKGIPEDRDSEICFIGRSNVGKSSLINAIFKKRNLARTSKTPGRTQELNFFTLGEKNFIVDLPGYGYAKTSKDKRSNWLELIKLYISERRSLKRVFTLIDSRHGLKENDKELPNSFNKI